MITTFDQALDKIYSYVDYSMTHAKDINSQVFTLDPIRQLLEKMGNPQKNYAVIHVAGTKGKGSVCAMIASALQKAGFKTGLYTSPHLIRFNERIIVDGKMINDADVIRLTDSIAGHVESMGHVSAFEYMTAMAFEYFREQKVDIAVIETGLGGRLDATNVVDPILSVITSVSYDHTNFLGKTIEKIAGEKAGIIKPGVPVICAFQLYVGAKTVIEAIANHTKSPWINVPDRYRFINQHHPKSGDSMLIWRVEDQKLMEKWCEKGDAAGWNPHEVRLPLAGLHQMQNAAVVYAVLNKLKFFFNDFDFEKAFSGIQNTFWPCRFEVIANDPMLIVDGAHNTDSVDKLCAAVDRFCSQKTVKCIFGASEDKDLRAMIRKLAPHVNEFIMTKSIHPRAADPKLLCSCASEAGRKNRRTESLEEAYSIFEAEKDPDTCYLAAGSLFVAGGIREMRMKNDTSLPYFAYNEPLE